MKGGHFLCEPCARVCVGFFLIGNWSLVIFNCTPSGDSSSSAPRSERPRILGASPLRYRACHWQPLHLPNHSANIQIIFNLIKKYQYDGKKIFILFVSLSIFFQLVGEEG